MVVIAFHMLSSAVKNEAKRCKRKSFCTVSFLGMKSKSILRIPGGKFYDQTKVYHPYIYIKPNRYSKKADSLCFVSPAVLRNLTKQLTPNNGQSIKKVLHNGIFLHGSRHLTNTQLGRAGLCDLFPRLELSRLLLVCIGRSRKLLSNTLMK